MFEKGDKMIRTNIYLSGPQHKAVKKEAKKRGISAAEVIRDLVDEGLLQRDYDKKWIDKLTADRKPSSTARGVEDGRAVDDTHKHLPDGKTA
jgi:hypothetical protein